jgi:hypothetical protein
VGWAGAVPIGQARSAKRSPRRGFDIAAPEERCRSTHPTYSPATSSICSGRKRCSLWRAQRDRPLLLKVAHSPTSTSLDQRGPQARHRFTLTRSRAGCRGRTRRVRRTLRSAAGRYRRCLRTLLSPGSPRPAGNVVSVHFPSTSFTSTFFRPPRPYTPLCGYLQAVRARR